MTEASSTTRLLEKPVVQILLGAALLLIPTLLNGFPFTYPDSTDYLTIHPQLHRLPFYGLLLNFFHLNTFIWAPILMQCAVCSHLLWLMMNLTSGTPAPKNFLLFMLVMMGFTSLPFFTGFIMADIFTPVMFLSFYILTFYHQRLGGLTRYYLFLLACVSIVTHIANLSLGFGLCILLMALLTVTRAQRRERKRAFLLIATPILLSFVGILMFNGIIFKLWTLTPAGQTFFMANMVQYGPARDYLDEACPTKQYRICAHLPLPETANEILWNKNAVIFQLGGFAGMREESREIMRETIRTRPHDVAWVVWDNFLAGLKTHAPAAEFYGRYQINPFKDLLRSKFGEDTLKQFEDSHLMHETIPYDAIAAIDAVVTPTCFLLLLLVAIATARRRGPAFTLSTAIILFILGDVLLCTALSGVFDRYQSRVTWLMPMALGLFFIDYVKKHRA